VKSFLNLQVLTKQTFKEVEKNSEDFDEVVYLDKVIKHLNDAERNMGGCSYSTNSSLNVTFLALLAIILCTLVTIAVK
jgi:hypothetical protein